MKVVGMQGKGRGVGFTMVEAARHWARTPGATCGFPSDVTRSLFAAGLGEALPSLGSLLAIFLVHGHRPLDLAPPGGAAHRADEVMLARLFERVVGQGVVTEGDEGTLSRWLTPRGVALGMRTLNGLARVSSRRTCRVALPPEKAAQVLPFPVQVAAE
ncbi:MAG: hypothetical protein K9H25_12105 [Rhodospirillum sp.]|nr:hypothetical protein [Rhodospirillum sp.]MCF8489995.1 hypothetical protein [Rhodospirillum sp.]MCF8498830.1 hypothetical protein [Rhodospirillum sp.]